MIDEWNQNDFHHYDQWLKREKSQFIYLTFAFTLSKIEINKNKVRYPSTCLVLIIYFIEF